MVTSNIDSTHSGSAATNQTFTSSGVMNITACPITYYGHKYDKVYVSSVFKLIFHVPFISATVESEQKSEDLGDFS